MAYLHTACYKFYILTYLLVKDMAKFVSGNINVLCEIDARKEVVELNSLWIKKIINMYVDVPGDEEFM